MPPLAERLISELPEREPQSKLCNICPFLARADFAEGAEMLKAPARETCLAVHRKRVRALAEARVQRFASLWGDASAECRHALAGCLECCRVFRGGRENLLRQGRVQLGTRRYHWGARQVPASFSGLIGCGKTAETVGRCPAHGLLRRSQARCRPPARGERSCSAQLSAQRDPPFRPLDCLGAPLLDGRRSCEVAHSRGVGRPPEGGAPKQRSEAHNCVPCVPGLLPVPRCVRCTDQWQQ